MRRTLILLFSLFQSFNCIYSQRKPLVEKAGTEVILHWQANQRNSISEDIFLEVLSFQGAEYDENYLPVFSQELPLIKEGQTAVVTLSSVVTEEITEDQMKNIRFSEKIGAEFKPVVFQSTERKKSNTSFSLIPLRRKSNGKIERLVSFSYTYTSKPVARNQRAAGRTYAPFSVLSTGTWYKIAVTKESIYKLSYKFLDSLGIDVKTVNPRNLRIYGNGGAMLPFDNAEPRPDDLLENPIFVAGEGDGRFDSLDYVLFYGQSPHKWSYDDSIKVFRHNLNLFSDTTFYFLTADGGLGPARRIQNRGISSSPATAYVNSFDDYQLHEQEDVNLVKSGRFWYGERFDLTTTYTIPFSFPNIDPSGQVKVVSDYMVRSTSANSNFTFSYPGGSSTAQTPVMAQNIFDCYYCDYTIPGNYTFSFTPASSQLNLQITFTKGNSNSIAFLNYIEMNARRFLKASGSQLVFRDANSAGPGQVAEFTISDASGYSVWDVTDPYNIFLQETTQNGNSITFRTPTDSLKEFSAFGNNLPAPYAKGKVENQNLHGLSLYQYVILVHPKFKSQADRLADLHRQRSGLKTVVVQTTQVYNEFGSGTQDITAIKDFMKMLYDRGGSNIDSLPRYLLLFGDASYSFKSVSGNTNYVPSYQSFNSHNWIASYVSDDYFGLLDDGESELVTEKVDLGIGRFPVQDLTQARAIVDKIELYTKPYDPAMMNLASCNSPSATNNFGDWRTNVVFIADDEDQNQHFRDAEALSDTLSKLPEAQIYNIDKIYFDSYQQQSVPGGQRYPDVRTSIVQKVEKGALILNYTGHGGELGWSHERVLEVSDINNWGNVPRLPLFVTATCEFSRFDDPARISAGEYVLLNPAGGGIGLLSTTRLVFSGPNYVLNHNFYKNAFKKVNGQDPTIGEVCKATKNLSTNSGGVNHRNFTLLGDPAMTLAYPKKRVKTLSINSKDPLVVIDTVEALTKVTISGFVCDDAGNKLTDYNGVVIPTVYDKKASLKTLANDPTSFSRTFKVQKNVIYKGKASVTNGDFSFTFIIPKDIAYNYDFGRVSYYAMDEDGDAGGQFRDFVIGGSNPNGLNDNEGPKIDLFMNDKNFISGGMTNENPSLYAAVFDSSGINTVGTGIGHDIVAVLDKNTESAVILNDYYEADLNSYQSGLIRYPYKDLQEGSHTLSLKVWDINNNSSERTIDFIVTPSAKIALKHVLNYPNPFTTRTSFFFEHNQACLGMDVQIQIFTVSGKLVKTIEKRVKTEGYRSEGIDWDGLDDFGDKIGRGVYVYRVKVIAANGSFADKFEKLVILN